jgi:Peptidase S24-like
MNKDRPASLVFGEFASELIASGRGFRFQARGRSMIPTIEDGEILQVRPLEGRKLKIGDIVLVRRNNEFKAHRIVHKERDHFITRGDAGHEMDDPVTGDQIVGLVLAKQSIQDGHVVRLSGFRSRMAFFAREARRRIRFALIPSP